MAALERFNGPSSSILQNAPRFIADEVCMSHFHSIAGSCQPMWLASIRHRKDSAKRRSANLNSLFQTHPTMSPMFLSYSKKPFLDIQRQLSSCHPSMFLHSNTAHFNDHTAELVLDGCSSPSSNEHPIILNDKGIINLVARVAPLKARSSL